jgi:hypothetical protein
VDRHQHGGRLEGGISFRKIDHEAENCFLGVLTVLPIALVAQEHQEENHAHYHKHRVMVVLGHAHVYSGINKEGNTSWLVLPSWGVDYDYRLNNAWSVGLHTDFVVEN